jgi:hypothetical protein
MSCELKPVGHGYREARHGVVEPLDDSVVNAWDSLVGVH